MTRTAINIDEELHKELKEVKERYMPRITWPVFFRIAWPRCPACGGFLVQKVGTPHLVCTKCGKEYTISPKS